MAKANRNMTFKMKGLKRWRAALDARGFDKEARVHMRRATKLNGLVAVKEMRKLIQGGSSKYRKNAPLTSSIKKSEVQVVDHGDLFQSLTSQEIDDFTVFVGTLRTDKSFNVAVVVHEGTKIRVTAKMRGMFFMLWQASEGAVDPSKLTGRAKELFARMPSGWKPLASGTRVIAIPPRRWVDITFRSGALRKQVRANWKEAMDRTFWARAHAVSEKET